MSADGPRADRDEVETFAGGEVHSYRGIVDRWLLAVYAVLAVWGVYYLLTRHASFFKGPEELALAIGVAVGFAFNYLGARLLVFGRSVMAKAARKADATKEPESAAR